MMGALRWILLLLGVVFLAALTAWEMRRPRQGNRESQPSRGERAEPSLGTMGALEPPYAETPPPNLPPPLAPAHAQRLPVTPPPLVDLPPLTAERSRGSLEPTDEVRFDAQDWPAPHTELTSIPVLDFASALPPAPIEPEPLAAEAAEYALAPGPELGDLPAFEVVADQPLPSELPPLIVEWPADHERHVITLRLAAGGEERLPGRAVRQALAACGFVHGRFGIFHQPGLDGRALLSVASASKPGIFDPASMDFQRFSGLSLFAVLPGPLPPAAALDHLLDIGHELAQRLGAMLQDEQGLGLNTERLQVLRDTVRQLPSGTLRAEPAA